MNKPSLIAQLAEWIIAFDAAKIPPEVARQAKQLLLDAIGCALAAHEEEVFEAALAAVQEIGGAPHCSVIGRAERTSLPNAVFLNGTLIRSLDANDIYIGPRLPGHPPAHGALGELAPAGIPNGPGTRPGAAPVSGDVLCRIGVT